MKLTTSPRLEEMLQNMGIHSYLDVLGHLPRRYDNFTYTDSKWQNFDQAACAKISASLRGQVLFSRRKNTSGFRH